MCQAIFKPEGVTIDPDHLFCSWENNPHGCGAMWRERGRIQIFKTMSFDTFLEWFYMNEMEDKEMALHLRWRSVGAISADNLHPFKVGSNGALVHNGTIFRQKTRGNESDTKAFADRLSRNPTDWWNNAVTCNYIEEYIGPSRIIFMHGDGTNLIFNEHHGYHEHGCWWSNLHHRTYVQRTA